MSMDNKFDYLQLPEKIREAERKDAIQNLEFKEDGYLYLGIY